MHSYIKPNLFKVLLSDLTDDQYIEVTEFIKDTNLSLISSSWCDVSDVSGRYDVIFEYVFETEQDALMFTLKFKGTGKL